SNRPWTTIQPAVRLRSRSSSRRVPFTVRPPSAGGLTSSTTVLPVGITTWLPATGTTPPGQVAGLDHSSNAGGGGGGGLTPAGVSEVQPATVRRIETEPATQTARAVRTSASLQRCSPQGINFPSFRHSVFPAPNGIFHTRARCRLLHHRHCRNIRVVGRRAPVVALAGFVRGRFAPRSGTL